MSGEFDKTYNVVGTTAEELGESINANSPFDGAFGYTEQSNVKISWQTINVGDYCDLATVSFEHDITIFMPKWTNKTSAKKCLQDNWDSIWESVRQHEEEHRRIFRQFEPRVKERLIRLEPQPSCEMIEDLASEEVKKITREIQEENAKFHASDRPLALHGC